MYKRVVVPLDGSKLAEEALKHLDEVADCTDVMLVSVTEEIYGKVPIKDISDPIVSEHEFIEPPPQFTVFQPAVVPTVSVSPGVYNPTVTEVIGGKMAKTANEYLLRIAEKLAEKGFGVTTDVLLGNPAEEIVRFAEEQKADLILMASRGKSGLSHWNMENVAKKVAKKSSVPVMLVKPAPGFKETKSKRKGVAS